MWRFDDLIIVNEVIKQKSFVKASKVLGIPSSTVSRRVSEFEEALGVRLLERNSRKLSLTDKGALLFKQCNLQLQTLKDDVNALSQLDAMAVGSIKITAPVTLGSEVLSPFFCQFSHKYPDIRLDITLTNEYEDILDKSFDIAIRVGPLEDSQFIGQLLCSSQSIFVASSKYIKDSPIDNSNILSISQCDFLSYINEQKELTIKDNNTTKQQTLIPVSSRMSSSSTRILRDAAINHLGIACLPLLSVKHELETAQLIHIYPDVQGCSAKDIYAVYPSKKYHSERMKLFLAELKKFIQAC